MTESMPALNISQARAVYLEGIEVAPSRVYEQALGERINQLRAEFACFIATPAVRGYQDQLRVLGFNDTRPANLKLMERCLEKGALCINNVVDAYNLAALTFGASLGGHGLSQRPARIEVRLAQPGDRIVPLFQSRSRPVAAGSIVYGTGDELMACIGGKDVDAELFRISEATTAVLLVSLGHHQVDAAFNEGLLRLAVQHISATCPQVRAWSVPVTAPATAATPA